MGTNQLFPLDTNTHAEDDPAEDNFNKGFDLRKALLVGDAEVNVVIPLNRYSIFESFDNELFPNMKVGIIFNLEEDDSLIWQGAGNCRVVVKKMQLFVSRIFFTVERNMMYMDRYMKPHKWIYLREEIYEK